MQYHAAIHSVATCRTVGCHPSLPSHESLLEIGYEWLMLAAAALHCWPQLQLKTDSAQQSADCRVIKAEMAVFTRGE